MEQTLSTIIYLVKSKSRLAFANPPTSSLKRKPPRDIIIYKGYGLPELTQRGDATTTTKGWNAIPQFT